ncbi:MAG: arginine--tRNA ligase [Gemmatimonadetes bacterium]|nr:arginine--tRNA ligase [Gemmatimonadota bacterium]
MDDRTIQDGLEAVLKDMGAGAVTVKLDRPKDPKHGDFATNVALTLAAKLGRNPKEIAADIVSRLSNSELGLESVEVAGPGFLNFRLANERLSSSLRGIVLQDREYGKSSVGDEKAMMVEFVSANPTGPLHLGHGRQAALGDAIASLLEWTGWAVTREYYYNDAGTQIDRLAESVWVRYQQDIGEQAEIPEGGYSGDYISDISRDYQEKYGKQINKGESAKAIEDMKEMAIATIRSNQDSDLDNFGVQFDNYFLESSLYTDGRIDSTVESLRETGKVYEHEGAVWLKTTDYGDQKDRVMVKNNGSPTYFLPDVAYHMDKWKRGFESVINVQGSDHHGTIDRVRAGLQALGLPKGYPEYVLHQMVRLERDGEEVKFSKRSGSYITLRELIRAVGVDVTRYFFQMRKAEGHLVFDLGLALDRSDKNPVFKIQYAHARMCSIFKKSDLTLDEKTLLNSDLTLLTHPRERELINQLLDFPEIVDKAAENRSPHLVCDYLEHTSGMVNSWYHSGNPNRNPELAVLAEKIPVRYARLILAKAVRTVLGNGLKILGISAPEYMERKPEDELS